MTSEKSTMIKRRHRDTIKHGDSGLFYIEGDDVPHQGYATNTRYTDGNMYIADGDDHIEVEYVSFWISLEDIKQHLSEDFVEIPSKEFA